VAKGSAPPWDQRIARVLVKPLARTPLTPNQLTTATLVLAWLGAGLIAQGEAWALNLGALLFALARFFDHFDGELARLTGQTSRFGYYYDYVAGALSYAGLFLGLGIGLRGASVFGWELGGWAVALGLAGVASALLSMFLNLGIDAAQTDMEEGDAIGYPGLAGFELEDGIYLIAPIAWLGLLPGFLVLAGLGASVYCLWTLASLLRLRAGA
jgi:phosphatidylglycerophosphate synthase